LPYLAPNTKAAVLSDGTITMQCAFSSSSSGMPLSGADITSENTSAAAFRRLAPSDAADSSGASAKVANRIFFIVHLFASTGASRLPRLTFRLGQLLHDLAPEGERKHALDDIHHSAGAVGARNGYGLYDGRPDSSFAGSGLGGFS